MTGNTLHEIYFEKKKIIPVSTQRTSNWSKVWESQNTDKDLSPYYITITDTVLHTHTSNQYILINLYLSKFGITGLFIVIGKL